jgi:hypothetical protein
MKDIKFLNLLIENSEFKVIKTGERTINKRVKEKIKKIICWDKGWKNICFKCRLCFLF